MPCKYVYDRNVVPDIEGITSEKYPTCQSFEGMQ